MTDSSIVLGTDSTRDSLRIRYEHQVRAEAAKWLTRRERHLGVSTRVSPVESFVARTLDDFWRQLFGDKPGKVLAKLFPISLTLYLIYNAGGPRRDLAKFVTSAVQYSAIYIGGGIVTALAMYVARERKKSVAWEQELEGKVGRLRTAIDIWDEVQGSAGIVEPSTKQWAFLELEQALEAAKRGPAA